MDFAGYRLPSGITNRRRKPKSNFKSSPLSGLHEDLELPAEKRHQLRNEPSRSEGSGEKEDWASIAEDLQAFRREEWKRINPVRAGSSNAPDVGPLPPSLSSPPDHEQGDDNEQEDGSDESGDTARPPPPAAEPFSQEQAALLFTPPLYQEGLYRIHAFLRKMTLVDPDSLAVVDPADLFQLLSFDALGREEHEQLEIVHRLRCQLACRPWHSTNRSIRMKSRILIPFH